MVDDLQDRFAGCLLGLALGDALGAPHEGGPIERLVWRLTGRTRRGEMRWTDDTQMALDLAESLIAKGVLDLDDLAQRFAKSYRWSRGYGPGTAKLLKRIRRGVPWTEANRSVYPTGSFGNGGAMRVPVVGLYYASTPEALIEAARDSAQVTHTHSLGLEGAVLIATSIARALASSRPADIFESAACHCEQEPFRERFDIARRWLESGQSPEPREVAKRLGRGTNAVESCVTSLYTSVRFLEKSFFELNRFVRNVGGDVDTIGAMAGAIWGAANGASRLPEDLLSKLEQRFRLEAVAGVLQRGSADRNS